MNNKAFNKIKSRNTLNNFLIIFMTLIPKEKALEKEIEDIVPASEEELEEKGIQLNDDHSSIK